MRVWERRKEWERSREKTGSVLGMGWVWQSQRGMRWRGVGSWATLGLPLSLPLSLGLPLSLPLSLVFVCSINWAIYVAGDNHLLLLVEIQGFASKKYFQVVSYDLGNWDALGG